MLESGLQTAQDCQRCSVFVHGLKTFEVDIASLQKQRILILGHYQAVAGIELKDDMEAIYTCALCFATMHNNCTDSHASPVVTLAQCKIDCAELEVEFYNDWTQTCSSLLLVFTRYELLVD